MKLEFHPFGLTVEPDYITKLKRDAAEIAGISVIALVLSCIGTAIAVFIFLTKSGWSLF